MYLKESCTCYKNKYNFFYILNNKGIKIFGLIIDKKIKIIIISSYFEMRNIYTKAISKKTKIIFKDVLI